jgi:hypothetical protein
MTKGRVMLERAATASRPELADLDADTVEVSDLARFPFMTGWFAPVLLGKLLKRVIISDVFGQYADRRLINAALDTVSNDEHRRRADLSGRMKPDADGAVWIDYVADLGDGFDATYAIAYLIAQPDLHVPGTPNDKPLPRGGLLIMGGDEVYPTAERDNYKIKMRLPYSYALPDKDGQDHPLVLLLPGNHDWYDGLVNFLAIFCREKPTVIGDWRTHQRRSYFGAKLTDSWWVWGIDIALVRDMDQAQADYFVALANGMPQGANIILCSAEPGWYKAETSGDSFRTLSYAAWIAENAKDERGQKKDLKIPLVLSGDSHHYAHYVGAGTHYMTSGGGGAFTHGTLELKPEIRAKWLNDENASLKLESCYPSQQESARLLDGNRRFGAVNPGLTRALAGLYLIYAFTLTSLWRWDVGIIEYLILAGGLWCYLRYQEGYSSRNIVIATAAHAFAHMAVIVGISWLALWINREIFGWVEWHWFWRLVLLGSITFTLGRWMAGKIFGWNLLLTCRHLDINHNDAFSALKLDSHRHFLRMRILGDTLTIFPIRLDRVPTRDQWRENPERRTNRFASVFIADPAMRPELIEKPFEIRAPYAPSTAEVKTPSQLPPEHGVTPQ